MPVRTLMTASYSDWDIVYYKGTDGTSPFAALKEQVWKSFFYTFIVLLKPVCYFSSINWHLKNPSNCSSPRSAYVTLSRSQRCGAWGKKENLLSLQRPWVWFPVPTSGSSQPHCGLVNQVTVPLEWGREDRGGWGWPNSLAGTDNQTRLLKRWLNGSPKWVSRPWGECQRNIVILTPGLVSTVDSDS